MISFVARVKKISVEVFMTQYSQLTDWGGTGPLVHIAHAIGLSAGVYTPFAEKLKPYVHPVGLDLCGHGKSRIPQASLKLKSWDIFYDQLEDFFHGLGRPVIAIGHSMGGTVSLVVAARRPDLVSALILIDPGVMPPAWRPWVWLAQHLGLAMHAPFVVRAAKRRSHWPDARTASEDIIGKGPFKPWRHEFVQAYLSHGTIVNDKTGDVQLACNPIWEGRCLAMAPTNIWRYVPLVKAPTLILYGKRSTTFLPSVVRGFQASLPDAEIRPFDDTGHFIPMERPEECSNAIIDFLRYWKLA
ncbi:MAG: alpha/beta hydrolase [Proteobacteria bacterium]|nr:alpha/beta hydrolase [Pseudomonadota bacterium]